MATTTHAPLPGSARRPGSGRSGSDTGLLRVGLHLLLAALPLLAISAHVFGLVRMQLSAALLVVPLATALVALTVFAPHAGDRVLAHGMFWGIVGCAIYDVFRLDTVYMLGWWADFIPTMGTWITGDPDNKVSGAVVGYLWRYIGDGGGIGITFFALASAVGLHQRSRTVVVGASIAFSVFPVWAGLVGTVALASQGQTLMFPLTPTTITLSLIGHLIFGLIMGLGFWHSRSVQQHWPWEPLAVAPARPGPMTRWAMPALPAATPPGRPAASGSADDDRRYPGPLPSLPGAAPASAPVPTPATTASAAWRQAPVSGPIATSASGPAPQAPTSGSLPVPPVPGSTVPPPPMSGPIAAPVPPPAAEHAAEVPALPQPRDRGTPARGLPADDGGPPSLDPHTWELWQRQMDTTVRGRRTHRARR